MMSQILLMISRINIFETNIINLAIVSSFFSEIDIKTTNFKVVFKNFINAK